MSAIGGNFDSGFAPTQMMNGGCNRCKKVDTDGNSTISKLEFDVAMEKTGLEPIKMEKLFNRMDKNGDGEISVQERKDMVASMEQRMGSIMGAGGKSDSFDSVKALMESLQSESDDDEEKQMLEDALEKMRTQGYNESVMESSLSLINSVIPSINLSA